MTLDTVFSKSFQDYKKNFKIIALAVVLLRLLPLLIITPLMFILVTVPYLNLNADTLQFLQQNFPSNYSTGQEDVNFLSLTGMAVSQPEAAAWAGISKYIRNILLIGLISIPLSIVLFIFSILFSTVLGYSAFNNKDGKLRFGEAFKKSLHYFWRFLGLILWVYLVIFLLFLALVFLMFLCIITLIGIFLIPFVFIGFLVALFYLAVRWAFAGYFILDEDIGVFTSLGKSKELVKGKFWRVLGYILLIGAIVLVISLVFIVINFIFTSSLASSYPVSTEFNKAEYFNFMYEQSLVSAISNGILEIIGAIIFSPFIIFFFKNFYLELKEEAKKASSKKILKIKKAR